MSGPMGWDDYGEKCREAGNLAMQVFACFTSPVQAGPPPADVVAEHKAYMAGLEASGKLFLAGPLSNEAATHMSGAGLIVFAAADLTEATTLAGADPMHKAGIRSFKIQAWRINEGAPIHGLRLSSRSIEF